MRALSVRMAARFPAIQVMAGLSLLMGYAVLMLLAWRHAYFEWDVVIAREVQSVTVAGFESLMVGISILGTGWVPVGLVVITVAFLLKRALKREAVVCGAGAGLGFLLNRVTKVIVGRPRPSEALIAVAWEYGGESFPSGHVFFFVEFLGFLCFLSGRFVKTRPLRLVGYLILIACTGLVGISRVYLGAHWPSDVLGGYLAGGIWLGLMIEFYGRSKMSNPIR